MTQQYGALTFPLDEQAKAADLLPVCDPVVARLSAFLKVFIEADIAEALTGALERGAPPVTSTIADTLTIDPSADTVDPKQVHFPLWCLWHKTTAFSQFSMSEQQKITTLGFGYILPAMTLEQARKYAHVRTAIESSIDRALSIGHHEDYNSDELVIGTDGGILEAKVVSAVHGTHPFGDLTAFYSLMGEILVTEVERSDEDTFPMYDGTSIHAGQGNVDGVIENFLDADTEQPSGEVT